MSHMMVFQITMCEKGQNMMPRFFKHSWLWSLKVRWSVGEIGCTEASH